MWEGQKHDNRISIYLATGIETVGLAGRNDTSMIDIQPLDVHSYTNT